MKYDWPVTDWVKPGADPLSVPHFGQGYRCPDCQSMDHLRRDPPNALSRHFCGHCRKRFENDAHLDAVVLSENFRACFHRIRTLAMAWQLTGEAKYADKAIAMALEWAAAQPGFTMSGERSCGHGTRLGANCLVTSWCLPDLAEARALVAGYPGFTPEQRKRWDMLLIDEGLRVTRQCGLWLNQQDEYIKVGTTVAMATGYWPLLGEAIDGDFGWHAQIEHGFTEEGIGHEGIAYHRMKFGCLQSTAAVAASCGLDLMTPRIKRIFDGSLNLGESVSPGYELAYRKYREPNYLPGLEAIRRSNPGEMSILYGVLPLPAAGAAKLASVHMEGSGYVMLRRGSPIDSWEIRLNYKAQLDRGEHDRFSTWFYRNNRQVDSGIGRRRYSSPGAVFQEETAAHNTIVIDGRNSRDVIGELVAYRGDGDAPFAVVQTDPTAPRFEGVRQLRGIVILGDAYVVLDRVECAAPRTIDRYQYAGPATLGFAAAAPAKPLAALSEKGRFTDVVAGPAGSEMRIDFGGGLKMRLVCDREMLGCKARTPTEPNETIDVTWARVADATAATFLATFSLGADEEPPAAKILKSTTEEIVLQVLGTGKARTITIKPAAKSVVVDESPAARSANGGT